LLVQCDVQNITCPSIRVTTTEISAEL